MALQKIGLFERLQPGEEIRVVIKKRFSLGETVDTYILASRLGKLEARPDWYVKSHYFDNDNNLVVEIQVRELDPSEHVYTAGGVSTGLIVAAIVGVSLIALSVTAYKVVDVVGDNIESPTVKLVAASVPVIAIALLLFAVSRLLGKK